jgi:uncharacterized membrane protein YfcA
MYIYHHGRRRLRRRDNGIKYRLFHSVLHTDYSNMIKLLLGVMLVSYSLYNLILKPSPKRVNGVWAYVAGFLTGVLGSAFSTGGPPTIIYKTLTCSDPQR